MNFQKDLFLYIVSGLEEDKIIAYIMCRRNKNAEVLNDNF